MREHTVYSDLLQVGKDRGASQPVPLSMVSEVAAAVHTKESVKI